MWAPFKEDVAGHERLCPFLYYCRCNHCCCHSYKSGRINRLHNDFKYLSDPLFQLSSMTYVFNKISLFFSYGSDWVRVFIASYLSDLLLVPVTIPIILFCSKALGLRPQSLPPSLLELAIPVLIWSIAFEVIGPRVFGRGVSDPVDVVAYCVGGFVSWLIWRRPIRYSVVRRSEFLKPT